MEWAFPEKNGYPQQEGYGFFSGKAYCDNSKKKQKTKKQGK